MNTNRHTCARVDAVGVCTMVALSVAAYFAAVAPAFKGQQTKAALLQQLDEESMVGEHLGSTVTTLQHQLTATNKKIAETTIKLLPGAQVNERHLARFALAAEHALAEKRGTERNPV